MVQFNLLEKEMKKALLKDAPKTMAVLDPVAARIINYKSADMLKDAEIKLRENLVLDRNDVNLLQLNQNVILKSAGVFKVLKIGE